MWNKQTTYLCVLLSGCLLSGCGEKKAEALPLKPDPAETEEAAEAVLPDNYTTVFPAEKTEQITVKADASGSPETITAEVKLSGITGEGYAEDRSILNGIRNTEGAEEYYLLEDDRLLWDNMQEDITYKGTTDRELPVSVHITYFLDGKGIEPKELAGKSGHVVIHVGYENHTSAPVTIDGVTYNLPVPFMAATLIPLSEKFENVQITNGKHISSGDSDMAVGFAAPGLQDSLKLSGYEVTEEVVLPEYVELEADVTDFELEFTTTLISSGLFEDLEDSDLDDFSELQDSMDELTDASSDLVSGTEELYNGITEFEGYLNQYNSGIAQVTDGIRALRDGLETVDDYSDDLKSGACALSNGLTQLSAGLSQIDLSALSKDRELSDEEKAQLAALETAMTDLPKQALVLQTSVTALGDAQKEISRFCTSAAAYQTNINTALAALDALKESRPVLSETERQAAATALGDNAEAFLNYYDQLPSQIEAIKTALSSETIQPPVLDQTVIDPVLQDLGAAVTAIQTDLSILLGYLDELQTGMEELSELPTQFEALRTGIAALAEGSTKLKEGLCEYTGGIAKLYEGASQLADGANQLPEAGSALSEGYSAISEGAWKLSDGFRTFDREGIQELAKLGGSELQEIIRRVKALHQIENEYTNYTGIPEGVTGSVRFLIETAEITQEDKE